MMSPTAIALTITRSTGQFRVAPKLSGFYGKYALVYEVLGGGLRYGSS